MHIALRVRNTDPLGIKPLFDRFRRVEKYTPVIARFRPGPGHEIDTAVSQFRNRDLGRRILASETQRMERLARLARLRLAEG